MTMTLEKQIYNIIQPLLVAEKNKLRKLELDFNKVLMDIGIPKLEAGNTYQICRRELSNGNVRDYLIRVFYNIDSGKMTSRSLGRMDSLCSIDTFNKLHSIQHSIIDTKNKIKKLEKKIGIFGTDYTSPTRKEHPGRPRLK